MYSVLRRTYFLYLLLQLMQVYSHAVDSKGDTNVLLITVDTLRADRLNCYGYSKALTPVIDRLAAEGYRFEHAYAQVPLTLPSHYSILSGAYPLYHGVRDNSQLVKNGPPLVSEALQHYGYRTGAFVGSFVLDSRFGLSRGFDVYGDDFDVSRSQGSDLSHIERPAEEVVQKALAWITQDNRKFFAWVHLFDPHDPYSPREPFKSRFAHSPYDGEIAYVDHAIGILLANLKQKGLLANTHIVVTADHGEALGEHGEFTHGFFAYDSTLHVPLIVHLANSAVKGRSIDYSVRSVDIAPTILRLVGLQPAKEMQGRSLMGLLRSDDGDTESQQASIEPDAYFETFYPLRQFGWSELRGIRTSRHKYIEAPQPELYDLSVDPNERKNIYQTQQALAAQMKQRLREQITRYAGPQASRQAGAPESETLRLLHSLGYVAGAGGKSALPAVTRADPKEKIGLYARILSALASANRGQHSSAARVLEDVLNQSPEASSVRVILALQYEKLGDLEKAAQQFSRVVADDSQNVLACFNLARTRLKQGKVDEAVTWYEQTLKIDPAFTQARTGLGIVYRNRKQWSRAIEEFEEALEVGPNYIARHNLATIYAQQGALDQAMKHAREAVKLGPKQAESYNVLGSIYLLMKQLQEAERSYLQVIELSPQSDTAFTNLAKVYVQTHRSDKARNALHQALKINPNQEMARRLLAQLGEDE
jgi:arylsulfatase A-like enzyme/tetratricopeptide (TPR) repeat protein